MGKKEMKDWLNDRMEDLKGGLNDLSIDFVNEYELGTSDYLSDLMCEFADSHCSIYYHDLIEWLKCGGDDYVERYVEEFGVDANNFDFWGLVRGSQFLDLQEQLFADEKEIIELLVLNYLLNNEEEFEKELEESELEELIDEVIDELRRDGRLDVIDVINKYIKKEESEG